MIRSDFIAASVVAMATVSGLDAILPDAASRPAFLAKLRVQVSAI
ncbi:MAG: hypothetical protein VX463_19470 [Pseudomonadota bacterium]|nr:hypothetical protein [Pseudomonadota bacterium]